MEELCKSRNCKNKLSEYRELNSKLYDDIYSLESDIKDKDDFLQKVIKARNALQTDVSVLKQKNKDLTDENNDLQEKNDQLDEDAEDGLAMLRNAHERERKLNKEVEDYKKSEIEHDKNICRFETEKKELKSKFMFLKDKFEKSLKENQEASKDKEAQIIKLHQEIITAKVLPISDHDGCYKKAEVETKLKEQSDQIEVLQIDNESIKQKNADLVDEIALKNEMVQVLECQSSLKSSGSSLSEELAQVEMFECHQCSLKYATDADLKEHVEKVHVAQLKDKKLDWMAKLSLLERKVSYQKLNLTSSLFNQKKQEEKERHVCKCKTYCRIYHHKHNYIRSKCDEIFSKLGTISPGLNTSSPAENVGLNTSSHSENVDLGAIRKYYSCNQCDETFLRQGDMKQHKKRKHKSKEKENGEVPQYGQKGGMSD